MISLSFSPSLSICIPLYILCIYIYIYNVYAYIYIYTYTYICIYIYINKCVYYGWTYRSTYGYMYTSYRRTHGYMNRRREGEAKTSTDGRMDITHTGTRISGPHLQDRRRRPEGHWPAPGPPRGRAAKSADPGLTRTVLRAGAILSVV